MGRIFAEISYMCSYSNKYSEYEREQLHRERAIFEEEKRRFYAKQSESHFASSNCDSEIHELKSQFETDKLLLQEELALCKAFVDSIIHEDSSIIFPPKPIFTFPRKTTFFNRKIYKISNSQFFE